MALLNGGDAAGEAEERHWERFGTILLPANGEHNGKEIKGGKFGPSGASGARKSSFPSCSFAGV